MEIQNRTTRRLQLWSYNYSPEPTGIGPVSALLATLLRERGWEVDVVAAHPHYPEQRWGRRLRPYTEWRDGIRVVRLPLLAGRGSTAQRLRQELSYGAALTASLPWLRPPRLARPDLMLAVSPSFPSLLPAVAASRMNRVPLVLWLQDILPDGAGATGLLKEDGALFRASRRVERIAYRHARSIVVLSAAQRRNLVAKGVPPAKLVTIPNPATRDFPGDESIDREGGGRPRILSMGNIGRTQSLASLVAAFERSPEMETLDANLRIAGTGVEADAVASEVRSDRVSVLGLVSDAELDEELLRADLSLVSQARSADFNLPSKLMNFMSHGLPVIAVVNPEGEVARLVREAGAGWVVDSAEPHLFPPAVAEALAQREERHARGRAAREFALQHFSPDGFAEAFDVMLRRTGAD